MQKQALGARKVSSALARVFAVWRTGLPRPVLVLQGGNALNYFGTGLILPFEIIYLHAVRGFATATAGLVLATVMGTAAVVTLPSGALLDRCSAQRILIAGNVVNALGYGGLAFVDRPWQGVVCSAVGGAGFSNILPPFAVAHTPVGAGEIGGVVFLNTFVIVVAQVPATWVVKRLRRTHALAVTSALFAIGLLAVLLATRTHSTLAATTVLAGVAI